MDFYDFLIFHKKIREREENKVVSELRKIQLLTAAIHTSEPNELISQLEDMLNDDPSKDIVGDLDELEKLKHKREAQGMVI